MIKQLETLILSHYNNPKTKPNIDFLLNLKNLYDYVPKHDKTKKCLYCNNYNVIKSHSVSKNQLDEFSRNEQLYGINQNNPFLSLLFLLKIIIEKKEIDIGDYPFEKVSINNASTFPGFCGSEQGKKLPNHDYELFHNIDGRNGLTDKNSLLWEILYRTLSWKMFKFESEMNLTLLFQKQLTLYPNFLDTWKEIISCDFNKDNTLLLTPLNDEIVLKYNIEYIQQKLKNLVSLRSKNLFDNYDFIIEEIDNSKFIGVNYFLTYDGENNKFIKEFNSDLCAGILIIEKKYYSFLISEKSCLQKLTFHPMKIIKELLLLEDPSNTFIRNSSKEEIQQYLDKI